MKIDLNAINSPADIKGMDFAQLQELSAELRAALLRKLSARGGHVGPNLGVVEAVCVSIGEEVSNLRPSGKYRWNPHRLHYAKG